MFPLTHGVIASSSGGAVAPSTDFIIRVKTDNAGTSASNQFTLQTTIGSYNYDVDWGDGVVENITVNTSPTHTYPIAGTYTITISGIFPRVNFNNGSDKLKIIELVNLGDVGWTNLTNGFYGCANMVINPNCTGEMSGVTSCSSAFRGCNLTFFPEIDFPNATVFTHAWSNNLLTSFPLINMSSAIALGGINNGAWLNNLLESFPAIDFPNVTICRTAWMNNNLNSFPEIDFPLCTDFREAWRNNGSFTSFATRGMYSMNNGINTFLDSTLPTSDYSDILVTQRANNVNTGVTFHGGNSKYNVDGGVARGELVSIQSWTITDGGAE